jgi:hypothetical protein
MVLQKQATVDKVAAMVQRVVDVYVGDAYSNCGTRHRGGCLTLIKGLIFLSPEAAPSVYLGSLQYERLFYVCLVISTGGSQVTEVTGVLHRRRILRRRVRIRHRRSRGVH